MQRCAHRSDHPRYAWSPSRMAISTRARWDFYCPRVRIRTQTQELSFCVLLPIWIFLNNRSHRQPFLFISTRNPGIKFCRWPWDSHRLHSPLLSVRYIIILPRPVHLEPPTECCSHEFWIQYVTISWWLMNLLLIFAFPMLCTISTNVLNV